MLHNAVSRKYDLLILGKIMKQLILLIGQLYRLVFHKYLSLFIINHQIPDPHNFLRILISHTAKQCLHTGNKLHHTKRLCHIIISSIVQPLDLIKLRGFCRHHNDRYFPCLPSLPQLF